MKLKKLKPGDWEIEGTPEECSIFYKSIQEERKSIFEITEGQDKIMGTLKEKERKLVDFIFEYHRTHSTYPTQKQIQQQLSQQFPNEIAVNRTVKNLQQRNILFAENRKPKYIHLHEVFIKS